MREDLRYVPVETLACILAVLALGHLNVFVEYLEGFDIGKPLLKFNIRLVEGVTPSFG